MEDKEAKNVMSRADPVMEEGDGTTDGTTWDRFQLHFAMILCWLEFVCTQFVLMYPSDFIQ